MKNMMVYGRKEKSMVKDFTNTLMAINIKGSGRKVRKTELVL